MNPLADCPVVAGLGEVLWDCIGDARHPGGAPANVAFHAAQLGCRGVICSRVGTDELGDEFLDFIRSQGLETGFIQRDARLPTGRASVDASVPGSPRFIIHENVAWDALAFDDATRELMGRADAVCFGTLAQRSETSRQTIQRCLREVRPDCLKVFDVNLRQSYYTRECIEESLAAAGVVKLNVDEMGVISRLLELPSQSAASDGNTSLPAGTTADADLVPLARTICERFTIDAVCITRAERGCLLVAGDEVVDQPGRPVEVVDAVGAGDAFTAALIFARLSGWPLPQTAAFANEVGGLVAARPGAMPPLPAELNALKARHAQVAPDA